MQTAWSSVFVVGVVASLAGCSYPATGPTPSIDPRASASNTPAEILDASASAAFVAASTAEPLRIEVLGDSITEVSCTSQLLWQNLRAAGATDFDMVGTHHSGMNCGVADADRDDEGHSGYLATDMVDTGLHAAELTAWCNADRGNVVLMHLGTNDLWYTRLDPQSVLSAFSKIITALRAVQPKVVVFVAQIIPMNPSDCSECAARVLQLDQEIPVWAAGLRRDDSPVYVVDQFTGFDTATDTIDGVHPNMQGAKKMADAWSAALLTHLEL